MNKTKFLTFAVVALVATNLLLIGSMLFHRFGPPPRHGRAREMVIRELHFDRSQIRDYDKLIRWHRSHIDRAEHRIMDLKLELYRTLDENPGADKTQPLMDSIGEIQVEIEHIHYKHFQDIRRLCRPDQLEDYDDAIRKITDIFRHEG
jgi:hypothetical protein